MDGLPFPRSYWVEPFDLLAGCFPGGANRQEAEAKLRGLAALEVEVVVSLMEPDEVGHDGLPFHPYESLLRQLSSCEVTFARFPIRDVSAPSRHTMHQILDFLDAALRRGRRTYVHCWGGRGRTGTVVGCLLARHGLARGSAVLDLLADLRRGEPTAHKPSPETRDQTALVTSWGVFE